MHDSMDETRLGAPLRTELELAALRRDVDLKTAYNDYLERMLLRLQEAEAWLRGESTRLSEALILAQADVRAERASTDQLRALSAGKDAELEQIRARVQTLEADCAALHLRLVRSDEAAAELRALIEFERGLSGNRIARRIVNTLQRFPRTLKAVQGLLKKLLGSAQGTRDP